MNKIDNQEQELMDLNQKVHQLMSQQKIIQRVNTDQMRGYSNQLEQIFTILREEIWNEFEKRYHLNDTVKQVLKNMTTQVDQVTSRLSFFENEIQD